MNTGQAMWLDESTGAEAPRSGSPVPVSGLRSVVPSARETQEHARRSRTETLPCAGMPAAMEEPCELPTPSQRARNELSWCIDFGDQLRTMSTFDLWMAIERGEISATLRVWREGMECWTPIERVPSLAVALINIPPLTTPSPTPAAATTGPAPEVRDRPVGRPVPASLVSAAPTPPTPLRRAARSFAATILHPGTLWMALGSGVAAGAITAALMVTQRPAPLPAPAPKAPAALVSFAPPPRPAAPSRATPGALPDPTLEAALAEPSSIEVDVPRAHHGELGQHRLRRGKKPARAR